ncbi:hypothetical protein bcgnr5369_68440 [Bacillus cereus]
MDNDLYTLLLREICLEKMQLNMATKNYKKITPFHIFNNFL